MLEKNSIERMLLSMESYSGTMHLFNSHHVGANKIIIWLKTIFLFLNKYMAERGLEYCEEFKKNVENLIKEYSCYDDLRNMTAERGTYSVPFGNKFESIFTSITVSSLTEARMSYYDTEVIEHEDSNYITHANTLLFSFGEVLGDELFRDYNAKKSSNLDAHDFIDQFFESISENWDDDNEQLALEYGSSDAFFDHVEYAKEVVEDIFDECCMACSNDSLYEDILMSSVCGIMCAAGESHNVELYVSCEALDIYLDYRATHMDIIHDMFFEEDELLMDYIALIKMSPFVQGNGICFHRRSGKTFIHCVMSLDLTGDSEYYGYCMEYINFNVGLALREIEIILDKAKQLFKFDYERKVSRYDFCSMFKSDVIDEKTIEHAA